MLSAAWYAALGAQLAAAQGPGATDEAMPPWKIAVELLRTLVLAAVLAGLASRADVDGIAGGLVRQGARHCRDRQRLAVAGLADRRGLLVRARRSPRWRAADRRSTLARWAGR